ncbi:dihydroneopterin aldolase, partial [Staphylococcus aureus]|nr:dihydroneopterin aldolase [Staphylococcus aureus]
SAENEIGQIFKVDVTLKVDLAEAGRTDNVIDTGHYDGVGIEIVRENK